MDLKDYFNTENWFYYTGFYDFVSLSNPKTIVEIGVWKGHSISYLASKNQQSEIYAVDLFEKTNDFYYLKKTNLYIQLPKIYEIYNQYLISQNTRHLIKDIKSISWEASSKFKDEYFDFVYIDACHDYDCVVKDLIAWYPKVKNGGIFSGHDYAWSKDVKKAVDEFCEKNELELKTFEGGVWYTYKK